MTWFNNLFGNVLVFMPLGFLTPLLFSKANSFKRILLMSILVSGCIELSQFILGVGISDIDDVILNVAGGVLGYLVLWSVLWLMPGLRNLLHYESG